MAQGSAAKDRKYRIFVHHGSLKELTAASGSAGTYECRYLDNLADVEALYSSTFNQMAGQGYYRVNLFAGSKIGSDRALATNYNRLGQGSSALSPAVKELVDLLYAEANTRLVKELKDISVSSLTLTQLEKAESVLSQLYSLLNNTSSQRDGQSRIEELTKEYYGIIPHSYKAAIDSLARVEEKTELVQLIRDMLTVDELTGDVRQAETDMRYRALRSHISHLTEDASDYQKIQNLVCIPHVLNS